MYQQTDFYSCFGSYATKYNIPLEDIAYIALNLNGLCLDIIDKRLRFKVKLNSASDFSYFATCVNTRKSGFSFSGDKLMFNDDFIGIVSDVEKDTCNSTYFRRNMTELTINSNLKSDCSGCKFCGTYNSEPEEYYRIDSAYYLYKYLEDLILIENLVDLSHLVRVTICTGCFSGESDAVEHILMVRDVLSKFKFEGTLRYIGSQIRSVNAFKTLKKMASPFSLSFTVECFSNRNYLLKDVKADISLTEIGAILAYCKSQQISANFIYIAGLDDISVMRECFTFLKPFINRFPIVQILQNFSPSDERYRHFNAKSIDYYIKTRIILEDIFKETELRPRSWENYRGLWYETFAGTKNTSIRI